MEKGTEALAAAAEAGRSQGARGDRAVGARPGRDPRHARAPMEAVARALRAARPPSSACPWPTCSSTSRRCASAGPCGAWPRSSSTAARASRPTAWASGRCPRTASSSSARGCPPSAASRTATSARPIADWPYSVFTMAHGRSKEECDAILDSIAADTGIEERRTLYSSTEFKKVRLRYFTDEHASGKRNTRRSTRSAEAYARAVGRYCRAGSTRPSARCGSIGRDPIFVGARRGRRADRRRRQPLRRLGAVLGPADRRPRSPRGGRGGERRRRRGHELRRADRGRGASWPRRWSSACRARRWCA